MTNHSDASLAPFSREVAAWFGETRGRSVSAVVSDAFADGIDSITGNRPSREAVMPLVHVGMLLLALKGLSAYRATRG